MYSAMKMKVVSSLFDVRDFPVPGKKKLPGVEVEVYRPKRAAGGWEDVWKKNGEPEPIAGQGWGKSLHAAGCWGWLPRGPEQGKGRRACPGFYIPRKASIPRASKLNCFHLNF